MKFAVVATTSNWAGNLEQINFACAAAFPRSSVVSGSPTLLTVKRQRWIFLRFLVLLCFAGESGCWWSSRAAVTLSPACQGEAGQRAEIAQPVVKGKSREKISVAALTLLPAGSCFSFLAGFFQQKHSMEGALSFSSECQPEVAECSLSCCAWHCQV